MPALRRTALLLTALALAALGAFEAGGTALRAGQLEDFFGYWIEARVGLRWGWQHLYDQDLVTAAAREAGVGRDVLVPQAPTIVWLVTPLAPLPLPVAEAIWAAFLLAGFLVAGRLLAAGPWRWLYVAGAFAWPPVALGLGFGQASLVVLAAVAIGAWLLGRDRPLLAGLAFAVALVKPHLILLLPLALLFRPRALAAFAIAALAIGLAALAALGGHGVSAFLAMLALTQSAPERFFVPRDLTLGGLLGGGPAGDLAVLAVLAAVAWTALRERSRSPLGVALPAAIVGSLLVVPFAHVYDSALLAAAAWLRLPAARRPELAAIALVALAGVVETPFPALMVLAGVVWLAVILLTPGDPAGAGAS
jgi:glycosyl transferase family 87